MQGIFQKENTDKALKYGIYRHLPTYEKIIRNLVSFYAKKIYEKPELHKLFEACYRDNLHSIWAVRELYTAGKGKSEFCHILEKNMQPVYDSARRQGYEIWNRDKVQ